MSAPGRAPRQLKLGFVPTGVGGPGDSNRWLDPDIPVDIVNLPGFTVTVGDTDGQARAIESDWQRAHQSFDQALAGFGRAFDWHDFRQYDVDAPFPAQALRHLGTPINVSFGDDGVLTAVRDMWPET